MPIRHRAPLAANPGVKFDNCFGDTMTKSLGFTLIEVMITVAIIAIIASVAYPSYMSSVRKSNRAEAKTELVDVAQRLQRCYSAYARFDDPDGNDRCAVYEDLTDGTNYVTRGKGYYEISISDATATTYTLTATAVKAPQTGDVDGCDVMVLNYQGVKSPADCW